MNTPIQELLLKLSTQTEKDSFGRRIIQFSIVSKEIVEALEKEKEQIIDACNMGIDLESHLLINDGEEYYNQKFNQNK